MLASSIPTPFPAVFANAAGVGYIRTIPTASQISITPGAASLADGFPPLNFLPVTAGGVPPFGQDMNGIINEITAAIQWQQAGGLPVYNSTFQTAIGGYPNGAALLNTNGNGFWISTVDNNLTNPNTGGDGWRTLTNSYLDKSVAGAVDVTLSSLEAAYPIIDLTGAITANINVIVPTAANAWTFKNTTTGDFTITVKMATGTGVVIMQNATASVYSDGTNVDYSNSYLKPSSIQGGFKKLQASSSGVSANISVTADTVTVENSSGQYLNAESISLTIAGTTTGANALDTGTIAASTWYSVWVIHNLSTATTAGLLSLSATAPTLPSGYTYKARIGWIRTDSSGNKYPLSFKQLGREVQYVVAAGSNVAALPTMASGSQGSVSVPTWVAIALANYLPSTASKGKFVASLGANLGSLMAAPNNAYGAYGSATNPPPVVISQAPTGSYDARIFEFILESMNLYVAGQTVSNLYQISGWVDNL